jgi:hypothetical protein
MNCKKPFTRNFLGEHCTSVFLTKQYKDRRREILLDREKGLLIETQPYVIIEKQKTSLRGQIREIEKERAHLLGLIHSCDTRISGIYDTIRRLDGITVIEKSEARKFVRKCPMNDCRGFLSIRWKCGSCDTSICNRCNEEKEDDHECLPDNVATMELLNRDTKPCPDCGTLIHRIAGCSHMFCIECRCSWDWNTQVILKGHNTNPHYYEFMRNRGTPAPNTGEINCGRLPDAYEFRNSLNRILSICEKKIKDTLYDCHRIIGHLNHIEIPRLTINDPIVRNRQLRVKYLMNEISEDQFKIILQQNEKLNQKKTDFRNIYQMFVDVGTDILTQIISQKNIKFIEEQITILNNLREYFNENIKSVSKVYKCVYSGIDEKFQFWPNYLKIRNDNN